MMDYDFDELDMVSDNDDGDGVFFEFLKTGSVVTPPVILL